MKTLKSFTDKQLLDELSKRGYLVKNSFQLLDIFRCAADSYNTHLLESDAIIIMADIENDFDANRGIDNDLIDNYVSNYIEAGKQN